jgi:hypothetical protein
MKLISLNCCFDVQQPTVLSRVTVKVSDEISLNADGYERICSISKAYPRVEIHAYSSCGERVVFP